MTPNAARLAIAFSCAGHAAMHILTALYLTVVLTLVRGWERSYDELIGLWTLGALMIGLGAPVAGWLGDRWGEARMMVVFFLVTGGGCMAAGFVGGSLGLTLALAVLGLGASIYHPVGLAWIVRAAVNRGRVMGINGIFGAVGVALAATIAGGLTTVSGWRAAFIVPGAVCVGLGLALLACLLLGLVRDGQADRAPDITPPSRGDALRAFVFLSVTMAGAAMVFNAMQTAMPRLFELRMTDLLGADGQGLGVLGIGGLVTVVYLGVSSAQLVGGWLADRVPAKRLYSIGLIAMAAILAASATLSGVPLLLAVTAALFVHGAVLPAENLLLARYTPTGRRGLAFGAKFVLAFGVGPIAVQTVAITYGWTGGFAMLLFVLSGCGLVAWAAARFLPGERAPAPAVAAVPAE
ncbi:MAG: MFS transporter [Azospirillaceae bacterium]